MISRSGKALRRLSNPKIMTGNRTEWEKLGLEAFHSSPSAQLFSISGCPDCPDNDFCRENQEKARLLPVMSLALKHQMWRTR